MVREKTSFTSKQKRTPTQYDKTTEDRFGKYPGKKSKNTTKSTNGRKGCSC